GNHPQTESIAPAAGWRSPAYRVKEREGERRGSRGRRRGVGPAAPQPDTIGVYVKGNRRGRRRAIRYLSEELEQVHVIGKNCRNLRLLWVAGFGIALAMLPTVRAFGLTTTSTAISAQTTTQACPTTGL